MKAQLIVSILTFLLTPLFTVLIVNYRLKKRQSYWKKQQNYLKELEINRLKIDTYREILELLNKTNDAIMHHHVYAANRDVSYALSKLLKDSSPKDAKFFSDQFDVQKSNAEDSFLEMRELSSKVTGLGVNIKVYFDERTFQKFLKLKSKLKIAQQAILSRDEVISRLSKLIEKEGNWIEAKKIFTENYDKELESIRPVKETHDFLDELMKHFDQSE
ncbi:hypothetical protein [Fodinibius saliphilus]|uniref:hypothetical protein n=1 Tax=Fodinibius saliphilus TaxID=1920650 RepID=UPI00110965BF|nr:hypothetical protein [Fodinibius saliphilus]